MSNGDQIDQTWMLGTSLNVQDPTVGTVKRLTTDFGTILNCLVEMMTGTRTKPFFAGDHKLANFNHAYNFTAASKRPATTLHNDC
jgi:hypothetical protein